MDPESIGDAKPADQEPLRPLAFVGSELGHPGTGQKTRRTARLEEAAPSASTSIAEGPPASAAGPRWGDRGGPSPPSGVPGDGTMTRVFENVIYLSTTHKIIPYRSYRRKKLDDGWPESVEEQGLLLLEWRRNFRSDLWKMCHRQSRRGVSEEYQDRILRSARQ